MRGQGWQTSGLFKWKNIAGGGGGAGTRTKALAARVETAEELFIFFVMEAFRVAELFFQMTGWKENNSTNH